MGKTSIEWATDTWNPITGCSHAGSPGCDHCYARRMAKRLAGRFGYPESPHEFDVTFHPDKLDEPLRWRKPRVVFVCSMSDLFHGRIKWEWRFRLYEVMARMSEHTFLVLTKRPTNAAEFEEAMVGRGCLEPVRWPLPNVWLGVTVETQAQMWRVEELLKIPAAKRFVSFEPLLGPVDMEYPPSGSKPDVNGVYPPWLIQMLDGVIVGGESGPGARPMHPDWARGIRDQCVGAGIPFTFKQWGGWHPAVWMTRDGDIACIAAEHDKSEDVFGDGNYMMSFPNVKTGRVLDGQIWDEFPWKLIKEA